ncbi:hypothetical protein EOPP23_15745 [Endozoicomonas sp. OPT23]|uniref:hypothetical protein n=1 Tax=Endozoicomonas sp. OPT23 TaxID=2072845 RepID=UPI00129AE2A7|nr:hypothetical protein [Endozoicomonas sp. OPT23]MRI34442.1 hypothetical protein [Endozoicomonas sp. OPT23]
MHTIRLYQQGSLLDLFIDMSPVEAELKYQELICQSSLDQNQVEDEPLVIHDIQVDSSGHVRLTLNNEQPQAEQQPTSEELRKLDKIKEILGQALQTYNKAS